VFLDFDDLAVTAEIDPDVLVLVVLAGGVQRTFSSRSSVIFSLSPVP
jgi:hypothetical protein